MTSLHAMLDSEHTKSFRVPLPESPSDSINSFTSASNVA